MDGPTPPALARTSAALLPAPARGRPAVPRAGQTRCPCAWTRGGVIAPGYDEELDAHRRLRDDSRRVITQGMQLDFCQRFGVASLKIRHHAQLGYILEAPAVAVERLPRPPPSSPCDKGMANGARFTHPDLSGPRSPHHRGGRSRRSGASAWSSPRWSPKRSPKPPRPLAEAAGALALLDVLQSAARLAEGGDWCRPTIEDNEGFCVHRPAATPWSRPPWRRTARATTALRAQ